MYVFPFYLWSFLSFASPTDLGGGRTIVENKEKSYSPWCIQYMYQIVKNCVWIFFPFFLHLRRKKRLPQKVYCFHLPIAILPKIVLTGWLQIQFWSTLMWRRERKEKKRSPWLTASDHGVLLFGFTNKMILCVCLLLNIRIFILHLWPITPATLLPIKIPLAKKA